MSSMPARLLTLFVLLGLAALQAETKSIWDGVYTKAQAARGESLYAAECARCHKEDLTGYNSLLIGGRFMNDWREDKLESFFSAVKKTMPRNAPASLEDREYLDIVAYVLKMNSFPPGADELTLKTVDQIRVQGREGPEAVPDFSLIQVTGCLIQTSGGDWQIVHASEPVRTRRPGDSPAEELKSLPAVTPGTHTFGLLDVTIAQGTPPKNHQVLAKGFLIRKPGQDRINLSALQPYGGACTN